MEPMAAADPSAALRRRDLCARGARLATQMRADVTDLLDAYAERQGLDAAAVTAAAVAPDGVPVAAVERWAEQPARQRLRANAAAYRAFRALLADMLEEQREQGGPGALRDAVAAVLLQVSALAFHLDELLQLEDDGAEDGGDSGDDDEAATAADAGTGSRLGLFERKVRGLGVLRELARWAVRSARDLRLLAKPAAADSP